jgi:DNA primase catalytic core
VRFKIIMFDKIVESCQYLLKNFPDAQLCKSYLDSRLNSESQESFQFGYFPPSDKAEIIFSLIDKHILYENDLFYIRHIADSLGPRIINISYFEHHPLVQPFKNAYGEIIGLVGRSLLSDEERKFYRVDKYKNTKFAKANNLFGLYENKRYIIDQRSVYIVEGQFDVIKSVEKGFKNIVALGSSNMSDYQLAIISRYTNNLFLLLDNDEAGDKGRNRIMTKFGRFVNIRNFYLPKEYKDIDEYFSHNEDTPPFIVRD